MLLERERSLVLVERIECALAIVVSKVNMSRGVNIGILAEWHRR